ncbi:MAG: transcriptional regulator, LacI family, partial [Clostridia bacterium]|nr:transcriptional regulator, LacI family [Clostridia bacterium]
GAIRGIKERGLRIPEDIAIVGFNDTPLTTYMDPPMSSVEIFVYELGYNASEILINQFENPDVQKKNIVIKTELKVRKSSIFKR